MEPNLLMSRTFLILGGMLVVTTITSRLNKAYETSLEAVFTIGGTFLFLFMVMTVSYTHLTLPTKRIV